jgi:sugar lactone lactonase YvrE
VTRTTECHRLLSMKRCLSFVVTIVTCSALYTSVAPQAHATIASNRADFVWGQPDFHADICKEKSPSPSSLCGAMDSVIDTNGNLWVADMRNNRVLMYPPNPATGQPSSTPSKVFGQYGSFTTNGCDQAAPGQPAYLALTTAEDLCHPYGVAIDNHGTLYVADSGNNRVLVYFDATNKSDNPAADLVLGQSTFTSSAPNWTPAGGSAPYACPTPNPASACTLNDPRGVSIDSQGDVLVTDSENNRVLLWSASTLANVSPNRCQVGCFIPASMVWGQGGSFSTNGANGMASPSCLLDAASATSLACPTQAIMAPNGNLFIADSWNNRVLEFDHALQTESQAATMVYGQRGSFTSNPIDVGPLSDSSLHSPSGMGFDPQGHLWVADTYDGRVLEFPSPDSSAPSASTTAIWVIGPSDFTSTPSCRADSMDATTMCDPNSVAFDSHGNAFVADSTADRVTEYLGAGGTSPGTGATAPTSTATPAATSTSIVVPGPSATPTSVTAAPELQITRYSVTRANGRPIGTSVVAGTALLVRAQVAFISDGQSQPRALLTFQRNTHKIVRRLLKPTSVLLGGRVAVFRSTLVVRVKEAGRGKVTLAASLGTIKASRSVVFAIRMR